MNCEAMQQESSATSSVKSVSLPMHRALENIQGRLAEQLAARANVIPYYENTANANSIRMLQTCTNNDIRIYQTDYVNAFTDRGGLSNVCLIDNQVPKAFLPKWQSTRATWAVNISDTPNQRYYLRGYTNDISAIDAQPIYFVPLKEGSSLSDLGRSHPHLISQHTLSTDKNTGPLAWHKPVPNAFGITMNTGTKYVDPLSRNASASVVRSVRPSQGYYAQIPHGFIRIKNEAQQNASFSVYAPRQNDVFNFIKHTPVNFAEGPSKRHYQEDTEPYIDNILKALKNKRLPKESDCKALKPPATLAEAMQMTKKSDKIDNHTYKNFPPEVPQEIGEAFVKYVPQAGTKQSEQLHCYEAACFALLAARSTGANGDPFSLKPGQSGIAKFETPRNALSPTQKQFTKVMSLSEMFSQENSDVVARLKERCYQMFPAFNGKLADIHGWSTEKIAMGSSLYIYWNGTIDQETGQAQGYLQIAPSDRLAQSAPWVVAQQGAQPEGKVAALDCTITGVGPTNSGGLDLKGDWSYELPFDAYTGDKQLVVRNLATFLPASGVNGLLGEVDLTAQFGSTAQDHFGVTPGFSTFDITQTGSVAPQALKVNGKYSGPS